VNELTIPAVNLKLQYETIREEVEEAVRRVFERQDFILGFRPEHFLPKGTQTAGRKAAPFPFRVTREEYLGADRLLYGTLGGAFKDQKVIARLPSTVTAAVEPGREYHFEVEEPELKFFDKGTELRIAPRPF